MNKKPKSHLWGIIKHISVKMPGTVILVILFSLILAFRNPMELYFQQHIIDSVTVLTEAGSVEFISFAAVLIAYLLFEIFTIVFVTIYPPLRNNWIGKAGKLFHNTIIRQGSQLSVEEYQKTEFYEKLNKAANVSQQMGGVCFNGFSAFLMIFFSSILMAGYLTTMNGFLILILFFTVMPELLQQYLASKQEYHYTNETEPIKREVSYYFSCVASKEYIKETRLLGCSNFFKDLWKNAMERLVINNRKMVKKLGKAEIIIKSIAVFGQSAYLILAIYLLFFGYVSLGEYTVILTASRMLTALFKDIIQFLGWMIHSSMEFQFYTDFMDIPIPPSKPAFADGDICLTDVSYQYPNCNEFALEQINLTIHKGEHIAIVGENGSGKTTLAKCILGLYQPVSGTIRCCSNGKDFLYTGTDSSISAVFQNYYQLKGTVRENISFSQTTQAQNEELLSHCLNRVGLLSALANNSLDTMIGREFNGIELSKGQWQCIAIARGYFRTSHLLMLDEPTASIDPIKEDFIFQNFLEEAKGKTAVVITHRLGLAQSVDRILVLSHGRIIEQGTHDELMKIADGEYYRIYSNQQKWYLAQEIKH